MSFHSDSVDHSGWAATVRRVANTVENIVGEIQCFDAVTFCHGSALSDRFNRYRPVSEMPANATRELAYRAKADHR